MDRIIHEVIMKGEMIHYQAMFSYTLLALLTFPANPLAQQLLLCLSCRTVKQEEAKV